jgi:hypothetical protein
MHRDQQGDEQAGCPASSTGKKRGREKKKRTVMVHIKLDRELYLIFTPASKF